jgi:hypothetical protein
MLPPVNSHELTASEREMMDGSNGKSQSRCRRGNPEPNAQT